MVHDSILFVNYGVMSCNLQDVMQLVDSVMHTSKLRVIMRGVSCQKVS